MLKITKIQERVGDVLLKLEGKIMEQWAALLDGECRSYIRKKKVVYLDCSNVEYIDARGVEVVNNLPRKHVTVLSAPSVVQELLQSGGRS
jgi:anti-anti-sigma regulatory factor